MDYEAWRNEFLLELNELGYKYNSDEDEIELVISFDLGQSPEKSAKDHLAFNLKLSEDERSISKLNAF